MSSSPTHTAAMETQSASSVGDVISSAATCKVENVARKLRRYWQRERKAAAAERGGSGVVQQLSPPSCPEWDQKRGGGEKLEIELEKQQAAIKWELEKAKTFDNIELGKESCNSHGTEI